MRVSKISSFADLRAFSDNFARADQALALAVAKGQLQAVQTALRAGANPLQAQDNSGRDLFFQAYAQPQGEEILCELLGQMPALRAVEINADGTQMVLRLDGGHAMTLMAVHEADQEAAPGLAAFLRQSQIWIANLPRRDHETFPLGRARDANRRLVAAAAVGHAQGVETAMSDGATALACDDQGRNALFLAAQHSGAVATAMVAAMFANEPTLAVHEYGEGVVLRNQALARLGKGGAALFVAPDPTGMDLPLGHHISLPREQATLELRTYLRVLEDLGRAMQDLAVEIVQRNRDDQLQWPNTVDFQRLLAERFDATRATVAAELGLTQAA